MPSEKDTIGLSKFLSLVLRHRPETIGIRLDEEGWTDVDVLLRQLAAHGQPVSREALDELVRTNSKQRFALDAGGNRIRASQGHSVMVDLGYEPAAPPPVLFHGTAVAALAYILQKGLVKGSRHQVHLSADIETALAVGRRHGKPVVLEVAAGRMHGEGHRFYRSANGVWLVDTVPAGYLRVISE